MQGSEKQINWATAIKAKYDAALTQLREIAGAENIEKQKSHFDLMDQVSAVTSAAWWIDNKAFLEVADYKDLARGTLPNLVKGHLKLPA